MIRNALKTLWRLSPNCCETCRLTSDARERDLAALDRVGAFIHVLICRNCRLYQRNVRLLGRLIRGSARAVEPLSDGNEVLGERARQRIREALPEFKHPRGDL